MFNFIFLQTNKLASFRAFTSAAAAAAVQNQVWKFPESPPKKWRETHIFFADRGEERQKTGGKKKQRVELTTQDDEMAARVLGAANFYGTELPRPYL